MSRPTVSVVVAHYQQHRQLGLVLAALDVAHPVPGGFEVVVADDGSAQTPESGEHPYPVRVVSHPRNGYRAAANRNQGARLARGEVLCFLDADTVPDPGYVAAMAAATARSATLVVGRRRHADLASFDGADLQRWLLDRTRPGPTELDDPQWLIDGYRETDDLRAADDAGFRFVISAVLAVPRRVWEAAGGFDESFSRYGGEDWEFAQRCWLAGADLRHEPRAVAWHDGPDLSGRPALAAVKNVETVHLAKRLTHPLVRGAGLVHAMPDIVVEVDVSGWTLAQVVLSAESLLRGSDAGLWLTGADDDVRTALDEDPRVHDGSPPTEVLRRCRYRVRPAGPVALVTGTLADAVREAVGQEGGRTVGQATGTGTGQPSAARLLVWSTRDLGRARLHGDPVPAPRGPSPDRLRAIPAAAVIERWRASADRTG